MSDEETPQLIDPAPFRRLMAAREKHEDARKAAEKAANDLAEAEDYVYTLLAASPIKDEVKIDCGDPYGTVGFTAGGGIFGRVLDKDAAIRSLTASGHDDILVRNRSISQKRLNEFMRTVDETNGPVPDGLDYYTKRSVKVANKKAKAPSTDLT